MLSRSMVVVACLLSCAAAFAGLNQDEFLENGAGRFAVEIPGCPEASANIQSVQVEDLTIDERETTTGVDWDFRVYGPGDAHYGTATIRSRVGKDSKELLQWLQDASVGKSIRKNISIIIKKRDGAEARRYNLIECFPIKFDPGDYSPSSTTRVETIVVKIGSVEFASLLPEVGDEVIVGFAKTETLADSLTAAEEMTHYESPDDMQVTKGFRIDITGPDRMGPDNAWETCTGGALCIEVAPASTGASQNHVTTPGHKFVEEIQLRGPMTASRKWIAQNINDTVAGKLDRFNLSIVETGCGCTTCGSCTFGRCYVARYQFPYLSVDASGPLYEGVTVVGTMLCTCPAHAGRGVTLEEQAKLQEAGFSQQVALFQLQQAVNRDSEQFQALTNMQKSRHDAMMATIQNAR